MSKALEVKNSWSLVLLSPHKKPIGYKWVFKIKHHSDGSIDQYKTCLIDKGYIQTEDINYYDVFAHVAKLVIVQVLLIIETIQNWPLHQLDIQNAFFYGNLDKKVYMTLALGYPK